MTIHHVFDRITDGHRSNCLDQHLSKEAALKYLVDAELTYGSHVTHITDTKIRTFSSCFGSEDHMVFTGSKEEMAELVEIAQAYATVRSVRDGRAQPFTQSRDARFNRDATEFLSSMATGGTSLRAALWYMLMRKGAIFREMKTLDVQAVFELIYVDHQDPIAVFETSAIQYALPHAA